MTLTMGALFAGYEGIGLGIRQVFGDVDLAWYSEIEPAACQVLAAHHPGVLNLGDITAVDWAAVPPVDVLTGGFPCQDVSSAGKRLGIRPGTRSGLWEQMAYAISVLRPRLVVIENVRGLLNATAHSDVEPCPWCLGDSGGEHALRALGAVLGDLADLGYDARWATVRAADAGAPHGRARVFIVAHPADTDCRRREQPDAGLRGVPVIDTVGSDGPPADADGDGHGRELHARGMGSLEGEAEGSALQRQRARGESDAGGDHAAADAEGAERRGAEPDHLGAASGPAAEPRERGRTDWGKYAPAIARWEHVLGRPAPAPTVPGVNGRPRLSPVFVEFLMGLPEGHVTGHGLRPAQELKLLGNGVVPQQAALALRMLGVAS